MSDWGECRWAVFFMHKDLGLKSKKHKPGCVTRHVSTYEEGNPCSHRWNAAKRARADTRIAYENATSLARWRWRSTKKNKAKLASFVRSGKATETSRTGQSLRFKIKPFATQEYPWLNHAHHIIPRSVLAETLRHIARGAEPHEHRAFDVMIHGLLGEPYNLNDEPNVVMLPALNDDAVAMGLPRHLEGSGTGAVDHPKYNVVVRQFVINHLQPHYRALIAALRSRTHQQDDEVPAVRPTLESISNTTYEQILSRTAECRARGHSDVSLDSIAFILF